MAKTYSFDAPRLTGKIVALLAGLSAISILFSGRALFRLHRVRCLWCGYGRAATGPPLWAAKDSVGGARYRVSRRELATVWAGGSRPELVYLFHGRVPLGNGLSQSTGNGNNHESLWERSGSGVCATWLLDDGNGGDDNLAGFSAAVSPCHHARWYTGNSLSDCTGVVLLSLIRESEYALKGNHVENPSPKEGG